MKHNVNTFSFTVFIEHCNNHAVNSLEALSFKMLSTEIKMETEALFSSDLIPLQACNEFLRSFKSYSENELNSHLEKSDRSKCSRRIDFDLLYMKYFLEKFESRNGTEMFNKDEEKDNEFMESNKDVKMSYQLFHKDQNLALILANVSPLIQRVHSKLIGKLDFHK